MFGRGGWIIKPKMGVLILSTQILSETFVIRRRSERDMTKNVYWPSRKSTLYSCQILTGLEFSGHIFEKSSNVKFHENPSSRSRVVPRGRTDRQVEANGRFSQLCELAPKNEGDGMTLTSLVTNTNRL
jgi:hypothetical protein